MVYYYHVYAGKQHIDLVKATSEEDACNQVFIKWGNASSYSAQSFKAVRA